MRFTQKRKLFKYMHYAVDHVNLQLMFPDYSPDRSYKSDELTLLLNKTNLNEAQRGVIEDILNPYTSHVRIYEIGVDQDAICRYQKSSCT